MTNRSSSRHALLVACVVAALHSPSALASDPTGLIAILGAIFVAIPWTLASVPVSVVNARRLRFRDRAVALRHTWIGAIGPGAGAMLGMCDFLASGGHSGRFRLLDLAGFLGVMVVLALITSLPLWIHLLSRQEKVPAPANVE